MKVRHTLILLLLRAGCLAQQPGVLTRAYTNDRAGAQTHETILTRDAVATRGMVLQTTIPVIGDARGMEAQPLILPKVKVADGSTQDVLLLPSMANVVRGVNAETGSGIWQTPQLCTPVQGPAGIDSHSINDKWGILSTPVIDPDTAKAYMVAWCSEDGSGRPQSAQHHVFVLSMVDGSVIANVRVQGQDGTQVYSASMRKQRSSLLLTNVNGVKTVFWASGTVYETSNGAAGWVFAFDTYDNKIKASLAMSQGLGAGIWMGGMGLASDSQGFLYAITGNGSFNGTNDFGESFVKIQYQPPAGNIAAWLKVVSWWAPYSDAGRIGENPALSAPTVKLPQDKLAGLSAPSVEMAMPVGGGMDIAQAKTKTVQSVRENGEVVPLLYPVTPTEPGFSDEDLGSAGGTLIESLGIYLGGGKDGILYPVKTANMGNTQPADFLNAAANCAKLAAPQVWAAFSPGPVPVCPQDETVLDFLPYGKTRHLHATPVQYQSKTHGLVVFVAGENSPIQAWTVSPTLKYLARTNETASAEVTNSPGGMPGSFCTLSSNNGDQAVLWCSIPDGDGNATLTTGHLVAYDPETITNGIIRKLWDSADWMPRRSFNKFMTPTVWNGRVYLPNFNGSVDVYALTPQ